MHYEERSVNNDHSVLEAWMAPSSARVTVMQAVMLSSTQITETKVVKCGSDAL